MDFILDIKFYLIQGAIQGRRQKWQYWRNCVIWIEVGRKWRLWDQEGKIMTDPWNCSFQGNTQVAYVSWSHSS